MKLSASLVRRILPVITPLLALPATAFAQCPDAAEVGKTIERVFKRPIQVKQVSPSPLAGLCEVQVSFQGRPNILYTDARGEYFVTGHLVEVAAGTDLTEEALAALTSFTDAEMKKLEKLTALTVGTKGKPVYFVTDPQ